MQPAQDAVTLGTVGGVVTDGSAGVLPGVTVVVNLAEGRKCARSWKILQTVGSDPQYPDVTPRDAQALREWETMRKAAE
jgi:isoleucyl-tRNA synthetase